MASSSKILTVSYGTFSCTAEGFDDPLEAVKDATHFFRGVVREDRFFGAEPPQFDPDMAQELMSHQIRAEWDAERLTLSPSTTAASTSALSAALAAGPAMRKHTDAAPAVAETPVVETPAAASPATDDAIAATLAQSAVSEPSEDSAEAVEEDADVAPEETDASPSAIDAVPTLTLPEAPAEALLSPKSEDEDDGAPEAFAEPESEAADIDTSDEDAAEETGRAADATAEAFDADLAADLAKDTAEAQAGIPMVADAPAPDDIAGSADAPADETGIAPTTFGDFAVDAGTDPSTEEVDDAAEIAAEEHEAPADSAADDSAPEPEADNSIAAKLRRIRAVVSGKIEPSEADVEEQATQEAGEDSMSALLSDITADDADDVAPDTLADNLFTDTIAGIDAGDTEDGKTDDAIAHALSEADQEAEEDAIAAELPETDAVADEAVEDAAALDENDLAAETEEQEHGFAEVGTDDDHEDLAVEDYSVTDAPSGFAADAPGDDDEATAATPESGEEEDQTALRARVIKVKRDAFDAALASGQLEAVDTGDDDVAEVPGAERSSLTPEEEAELARELAAVKAELEEIDWDDTEDDQDWPDLAADTTVEKTPLRLTAEHAAASYYEDEDDFDDEDDFPEPLALRARRAEQATDDEAWDTLDAAFEPDPEDRAEVAEHEGEDDEDNDAFEDVALEDEAHDADAFDDLDAPAAASAEAEDDADEDAALEQMARSGARKALKMASPARAMLTERSIEENDTSVNRILDETNTQLDEPEGNRRRSAIAHLRAAVAATRADRLLGRKKDADEATEPYREDLANVVRPRRPQPTETRSERPELRPAPLKLVAEQRVDETDEDAREPVRPRRISAQDDETGTTQEQAHDFAAYAENVGAADLPELLEAAAAYLSFVEGYEQFSRPQLMSKVRQVELEESSREDRLRSFGQLLREGKIEKTRGGRFTASKRIGFQPENRAATG